MEKLRSRSHSNPKSDNSSRGRKMLAYIHSNLLNADSFIHGPFGDRKVVYCDFTASGLSLKCFEEFILNEVLTDYANVHSLLAGNASQTTAFRNDAKLMIIKSSVNAKDVDALIFVGNGTTGAIHKLIHNLNLTEPPIVLNGPFEHHSNLLPWKHLAHKVIRLRTTPDGDVCLNYLEENLKTEGKLAKKIGCKMLVCLSAASNVTGILVDTVKISALVHKYGGIIFWDYATAAPYVEIDMNPSKSCGYENAHKDAVYFSVHKFVGGPQTPGILIAKKKHFEAGELFPHSSGGGTVEFVRRKKTTYLKDVEGREEGGTPAIIESIRAGMVIQLKEAIGIRLIERREDDLVERAWAKFADCPNLVVLGGSKVKRLAIFSFLIRHTREQAQAHAGWIANDTNGSRSTQCRRNRAPENNSLFIHHDFICALLNDLFGIQSRSGCACAGPYALDLLGINEPLATSYEEALITEDNEEIIEHKIVRPGFTRINLPYFYPDDEIEFILDSVVFVATYAWSFLPFYELDQPSGHWHYASDKRTPSIKQLTNITYDKGVMKWRKVTVKSTGAAPKSFKECLAAAKSMQQTLVVLLKQASARVANEKVDRYWAKSELNYLRWFLLAGEAAADVKGKPRPAAMFPNQGSPWHPGCIERCFCPELAKNKHEDIRRLCEYTSMEHRGKNSNDHDDRIYRRKNVGYRHEDLSTGTSSASGGGGRGSSSSGRSSNSETYSSDSRYEHDFNDPARGGRFANDRSLTDIVCARGRFMDKENQFSRSSKDLRNRNDEAYEMKSPRRLPEINRPFMRSRSITRIDSLSELNGWAEPPPPVAKPFLQATRLFSMIRPGDRVLVSLSGGMSSMTLVHCLRAYQQALEKETPGGAVFSMAAVIVDLCYPGFDLYPLIRYLNALGLEHHYRKRDISGYRVHSMSLCSNVKQEVIIQVAREHEYNVLALAQNLDDMAAKDFNLRLIRPLAFCREKAISEFVANANLPVLKNSCPICHQAKLEQSRLKELLAVEESINPNLFVSISNAISPLLRPPASVNEQAPMFNCNVSNAVQKNTMTTSVTNVFIKK